MAATLIVVEKDRIQTVLLNPRNICLIGRLDSEHAILPEISLISKFASREHGWLRNIEDQWFYIDNPKNRNGTYHNGRKLSRPLSGIRQPVLLENGDVLRINGENGSAQGVVMLFMAAQWMWQYFALNERNITIGSSKGCELIIPGFRLDFKQAKLTKVGEQYFLSACDNRAVFCNKQKVMENVPLQYGDIIQLNGCCIVFLGNRLAYTRVPAIKCPCGETYCSGEEFCWLDGAHLRWPKEYDFGSIVKSRTYDYFKKYNWAWFL